jgi:luciferase family oxidoreductase group 1
MYLSVLDQSPIRGGASAAQAIQETLELAQFCDRLGFRRYWLAEHHATGGLAGSCPEILIGRVAALTEHMRIGSGGVMLSHYSAFKVAEHFRMLETLFPGRIDLGIGRAPGSDGKTAMALRHGPGSLPIEYFPRQIADLQGFLKNQLAADHPFHGIEAMPTGQSLPDLWLLGSSDQSAAYAAHFGCRFSFAHFINPHGGEQVMAAYREYFEPSAELALPEGSIAVFVICADSDEQAQWLRKSRDLWLLRLRKNQLGPIPTPEEADAYPYTGQDRLLLEMNQERSIAGSPATVRAQIDELAARYGVDEVVVVTICHDFQARLRSYELLARAYDLA